MRRLRHLPVVAVALAAIATATLAGCDSESSADSGTPVDPADPATPTPARGEVGDGVVEQLTESRWLPEHVTVDGTEYPRSPGLTLVHLALPEGGEFVDEFGCTYGSDVTVSGDTLLVDEVVSSTTEGCSEDRAAFEENFLDVFQGSLTYELDDEDGPGMRSEPATLTLTHPDGGTITLTENLPKFLENS